MSVISGVPQVASGFVLGSESVTELSSIPESGSIPDFSSIAPSMSPDRVRPNRYVCVPQVVGKELSLSV